MSYLKHKASYEEELGLGTLSACTLFQGGRGSHRKLCNSAHRLQGRDWGGSGCKMLYSTLQF